MITPLILLPLIHICSYDIWFYLSHRFWLHHPIWYPRIHVQHHSCISVPVSIPTTKPTAWIQEMRYYHAYVGHPLENIIQGMGICLPIFVGWPWIWTMPLPWITAFIVALLVVNVRGMIRHDARCIPWFQSTQHHLDHHQYPKCNYGEPWLDWMGGTLLVMDINSDQQKKL